MNKLDRKIIIDACCEAIHLWEFGNPDVAKKEYARTDKELMRYFGGAWIDLQKRGKTVEYDIQVIKALIHTCEIQKVLIKNPKLEECEKYISNKRVGRLLAVSEDKSLAAKWDYGAKFIFDLGKILSTVGGSHPALASRFLFFAVPQASIFNYSNPLVTKLQRKYGLKDSSVRAVGKVMAGLYEDNLAELSELPRPKFPSKLSKSIRDGGWWERRVLDLAILNYVR